MTLDSVPPDHATLDDRIKAVLSNGAKSTYVANLIREAEAEANLAEQARSRLLDRALLAPDSVALSREVEAAALRHDELRDAVEKLREHLRDKKAQEDRSRLLAKIEKIVGRRWRSIVDKGGVWAPKAIVEAELYRLAERCAAHERIRSRRSKDLMDAIRQFGAALRKANRPKHGLPQDFRLLLGLDQMIYMFEAYEKKAGIPKRDAHAKRMAALSAKHLCDTFGIPLRTTRKTKANTEASVFCQLAAVLFGDEGADLQRYCRELVSAKPGQK